MGRSNFTWGRIPNPFLWHHNEKNGTVPSRRGSFPSWAWVGWKGSIAQDVESGCLSVETISLVLKIEQKVPLSSLFSTEQAPTWEMYSQPKVLIWQTTFIDVSTAHTFATDGGALQFHLENYRWLLQLFLSIHSEDHEDVRCRFLHGQYKIMRVADNAGLVVANEGGFFVRIGIARDFPYKGQGFDTEPMDVRLV